MLEVWRGIGGRHERLCVLRHCVTPVPTPATETVRVMLSLYYHCGAQIVPTNDAYLTNDLGDVIADSKNLHNQFRTAIDADIGYTLKS